MYFGIAKIIFEKRKSTKNDIEDAKALCDKLKGKLPVCAKYCSGLDSDIPAIAISTLAKTEQDVEDILDKVLDICEAEGLGKIEAEYSLIEPIDVLEEDDEQ